MNGKGDGTRPRSVSYEVWSENHDYAFGEKKTPEEWCKEYNILMTDPDGWRVDNTPYTKPICRSEFLKRSRTSTIGGLVDDLLRLRNER